LIVEEDDYKTIKPLPNLDYKIVRGDSLSSVNTLFHYESLKKLEGLKVKFFGETSAGNKMRIKEQIDELIGEITHNDKHFDFKVYFSEVLDQRGGFDIVIANHPYVRQESIKEMKPELKKQFGDFFCGTADLYTYFYKRGLEILKTNGHLCFIAPNKFMRTGYEKNLRKMLTTVAMPKSIIDFCELPVFEAGTDPAIVLVEKKGPLKDAKLAVAIIKSSDEIERVGEAVKQRSFLMRHSDLSIDGWTLE